ncbi:MAG: aminotransferase class V-fold PLP-dependent enzyme [Ferruginibacter sp.]|nr:aminotransferase class V-fold PLP-dependent enzyme [Ferruginibacter sp.]MBU9935174.1 aminotransferase class V-fold PLP-dependent enzyme [Ferruginibacter sp.]
MKNLKQYFLLREDITYLNFGSFGACLKPVFEKYQQFQLELEQEPVQFITVNGLKYLETAREALADYVHCHKDDLVYVTNPSYAVNAVAKSFNLQPGDEILTTDLEYGACDKTWEYYCKKAGARYVKQHITLPVQSKEQFVAEFFKGLSPKTKLVFLSHITSSTGLRLPAEEICALAKEKGIMTFVDGAHAPGQIPLDLQNTPFDMYTGACHKWMMTPKGSTFLYVKKEYQHLVDPLVVSWGYNALFPSSSSFLDYHQMNGTRDYSAFLTIPTAIGFMKEHNWTDVAAACRKLVRDNAPAFCQLLDTTALAPLQDDFMLQLCSAEIRTSEPEKLHRHFFDQYKIEIPVMRHGDKVYLRYSINAFNSQQDLDTLFDAIKEIKRKTDLIGK